MLFPVNAVFCGGQFTGPKGHWSERSTIGIMTCVTAVVTFRD